MSTQCRGIEWRYEGEVEADELRPPVLRSGRNGPLVSFSMKEGRDERTHRGVPKRLKSRGRELSSC